MDRSWRAAGRTLTSQKLPAHWGRGEKVWCPKQAPIIHHSTPPPSGWVRQAEEASGSIKSPWACQTRRPWSGKQERWWTEWGVQPHPRRGWGRLGSRWDPRKSSWLGWRWPYPYAQLPTRWMLLGQDVVGSLQCWTLTSQLWPPKPPSEPRLLTHQTGSFTWAGQSSRGLDILEAHLLWNWNVPKLKEKCEGAEDVYILDSISSAL